MNNFPNTFRKFFDWFSINKQMSIDITEKNGSIVFTGKNDWFLVIAKRLSVVLFCIFVGSEIHKLHNGKYLILNLIEDIITLIPIVFFFVLLIHNARPFLQKTIIIFSPNSIIYNHTINKIFQKEIIKEKISSLSIIITDNYFPQIKIHINGKSKIIFDFELDENIKDEKLFKIFSKICQIWNLEYYKIIPNYGKSNMIIFSKEGTDKINNNLSLSELKNQSIESQIKLENFKTVAIGSYSFEKKNDKILIDYSMSQYEWVVTFLFLFFSLGLMSFLIYLSYKGNIPLILIILIVAFALILTFLGFENILSEFYLKYTIDPNNNILIKKNLFKTNHIKLNTIKKIQFTGNIVKSKYTDVYFGKIELIENNDGKFELMEINPTIDSLDVEKIKENIYRNGILISKILSKGTQKSYQWLDFSYND